MFYHGYFKEGIGINKKAEAQKPSALLLKERTVYRYFLDGETLHLSRHLAGVSQGFSNTVIDNL